MILYVLPFVAVPVFTIACFVGLMTGLTLSTRKFWEGFLLGFGGVFAFTTVLVGIVLAFEAGCYYGVTGC